MPVELIVLVLLAPVLLVAGQAALAPLETLLWSAGWIHGDADLMPAPARPREVRQYVVYLDGIGKTAPRETRVGRELTARLRDRLPDAVVLAGVLPYAVTNRAMLRRPISGRYWRFLAGHRLRLLLFVNNAMQTFVACDRRYREAYGRGVARTIAAHLGAAGYAPGSGVPVVLLGYSGGAQAACTAAAALSSALGHPPLRLVFIGGFHDGASDLTAVDQVDALVSRADVIERAGVLFFPARWPLMRGSAWNRARRRGAVVEHDLSPARHFGPRCYVSALPGMAEDGVRDPLGVTVDVLLDLVRGRRAR
jgi:hypothetical protein